MSLVEAPIDSDAHGADLEGAGVLSSYADLEQALTAPEPDSEQLIFAATAAGLDSLDAAMHPLFELSAAGVGWLIEHVWFLHEPLDHLAGDPTQITAQARTWHNASNAMLATATGYRADTAAISGWDGTAAEEYRGAVHEFTHHLDRAAAAAGDVSREIVASGAAVGTVRSLIRDLIADFVAGLIEKAIGALVGSFATFGGSALIFGAAMAVEAVVLATHITRRVERLLEALGTSAMRLEQALSTMAELRTAAVEAGKQFTTAEQEQRSW